MCLMPIEITDQERKRLHKMKKAYPGMRFYRSIITNTVIAAGSLNVRSNFESNEGFVNLLSNITELILPEEDIGTDN